MTRQFVFIAFLFASLLGACSKPGDIAKARLQGANFAELRFDAARIYKQLYASPGADYIPLKPNAWPASFKKLRPLSIGVYPNGFALTIDSSGESETGIHIVPLGLSRAPTSTNARYEQVADGVYWYAMRKDAKAK